MVIERVAHTEGEMTTPVVTKTDKQGRTFVKTTFGWVRVYDPPDRLVWNERSQRWVDPDG